jgi:phosphate acetyltransferase
MSLIERLTVKLQEHPKRIVFPEGSDARILQAARLIATHGIGVPILLGDRSEIKKNAFKLNINLEGIRILEPERSEDIDLFLPMIQELPRFAAFDIHKNRELLLQKNYFAAMMLATGRVDALVSGATSTASSALRPLFHIIPKQRRFESASSLLILDLENRRLGSNGVLFLSDCGVIPEPSEEQLADIALSTAQIARHLTNEKPRVAMLSWATKAVRSSIPASIAKVRNATEIARRKAADWQLDIEIDGEIQVDAALDPITASQKGIAGSAVAGRANVLIFPDLNCGNIVSKMVQIVTGAHSYGQIITGLTKPCAEISRGAHASDIFGTSVLVAAQALDRNLLFSLPDNT